MTAGTLLNNRYELVRQIGEGGMAVTHEAHDRLLDRRVAVKVMKESLARDPSFVEAFRNEAQAAASLSHQYIAGVYDTGADGQTHYIVMELVEGEDLKALIRRQGPLPQERAVEIAIEVAEALAAAHDQGIVHRDIKPHNILLTADGQVKVIDFGLARATTSAKADTDVIMGSVHYFSPEQARGDAVGPQSDIYALGVVLFEMLTGRLPFEGENAVSVAHKQVYDRPPAPHSYDPNIGPELDGIVLRCLEKDLSRRYASAGELLAYLVKFRAALDEGLFAADSARRPALPVPRWRRLAVAAGVVAIGGAIVAGLVISRGPQKPQTPEVPGLRNMDITSAERVLADRGYKVRVAREQHGSLSPGRVLRQKPPGGTPLAKGETVEVWLSLGPQRVRVPDVLKMSLAQAKRYLDRQDLRPGKVTEDFSETVPAGFVMATEPPVGLEVERRAIIALVVSKGPEEKPPEPGPEPSPTAGGQATITFTLPEDVGEGTAAVRVELEDANGRRVIYEGDHAAGESIPTLRVSYSGRAQARVYVDGKVRWSRTFGQ